MYVEALDQQAMSMPRCRQALEQVTHALTGLLSDERDLPSLATHLCTLAADRPLVTSMGLAGAAKMRAEYSLEAHARNLTAIYRELLD